MTVIATAADEPNWFGRIAAEVVNGIVALAYRGASSHTGLDGVMHLRLSDNPAEADWTAQDTGLDSNPLANFPMEAPDADIYEEAGEPWMIAAPNGDLLLHIWRAQWQVQAHGSYQSRSTDNGATWSAPAQITYNGLADPDLVFTTSDHFNYNGVIYLIAGVADDATLGAVKQVLITSSDNGVTWDYVSDMITTADDVAEPCMEYLGNGVILSIARSKVNTKTWKQVSTDKGLTWSEPEDITAQIPAIGRPRLWTKAHLRGEDNWWTDLKLIMCGFVFVAGGLRRNAVWTSADAGETWSAPLYVDESYGDGGYGDMIHLSGNQYAYLCYRGTVHKADVVQYNLWIDW